MVRPRSLLSTVNPTLHHERGHPRPAHRDENQVPMLVLPKSIFDPNATSACPHQYQLWLCSQPVHLLPYSSSSLPQAFQRVSNPFVLSPSDLNHSLPPRLPPSLFNLLVSVSSFVHWHSGVCSSAQPATRKATQIGPYGVVVYSTTLPPSNPSPSPLTTQKCAGICTRPAIDTRYSSTSPSITQQPKKWPRSIIIPIKTLDGGRIHLPWPGLRQFWL